MGTQLPRYWKLRDPEIEKLLVETWPFLPAHLKKTGNNIAAIRFGTAAFFLFVLLGVTDSTVTSTPAQFVSRIFSMTTLLAVIGVVGAVLILILRSMQVAKRFVDAYAEMLPDHAEHIRRIYAERGLGDVIAPWVRGKPGVIRKILNGIARRFHLKP